MGRKQNKQFTCADCGQPGLFEQMFRVHDELWNRYALSPEVCLCLPCFEERMGRPLEKSDLMTGVPANYRVLERWQAIKNIAHEYYLLQRFLDDWREIDIRLVEGKDMSERYHNAVEQTMQKHDAAVRQEDNNNSDHKSRQRSVAQ
jgi:hypothetical protein